MRAVVSDRRKWLNEANDRKVTKLFLLFPGLYVGVEAEEGYKLINQKVIKISLLFPDLYVGVETEKSIN